jgi:tRNA(fMet)-specific endonuclease VapC
LIILDTDIISLLDRKSGKTFENLARRLAVVPNDERVCATIISFEEQMRGWLGQIAAARKPEAQVVAYNRLQRLLENINCGISTVRPASRCNVGYLATQKDSHRLDGPANRLYRSNA